MFQDLIGPLQHTPIPDDHQDTSMKTWKSHLFYKILGSYLLLLLSLLLVLLFFLSRRIYENYVGWERSRLDSIARVMAQNLPVLDQTDQLKSWVNKMGELNSCRITIIDSSGVVIADNQGNPLQMNNHANRPEFLEAMKSGQGSSIRYSHTLDKNELYYAHHISQGGNKAIILRLAIPLQEISTAFQPTRYDLFYISLIPGLLACLLGLFFTRSLTRRISSIKDFSRNIAAGDFSAKIRMNGNDELGQLARSLNETAESMRSYVKELREERNRSNAILDGMQAGVLATDSAGHLTLVNRSLARTLGISPTGSLGRSVLEVLRNAELKRIIDHVLMEGREHTAPIEVTLDQHRTFSVVAVPLLDASTGRDGVVAVLHDVSRLIELENIRKDFVANLSHELRTPLTSIRGFADTLLDGALEDKKNNRRFVEIIRNHAIRLTNLTNDLLTLASLESEQVRLSPEALDWRKLVEEIVESARPGWDHKQQAISIQLSAGLDTVQADREKMHHVLVNLLDNAIKFTPVEGQITLSAEIQQPGGRLEFHVKDTGIGIPSLDIPRIFERFYRVDKARSSELGGTGLGLSIVKHVVELHGGNVGVNSQLGHGSDFWFTLPVSREAIPDL
jgi:two-component system, OmpR family, phosphate regulon sensor histidine kinase PhoR